MINLEDALDVGLHGGARQRAAGFRLDLLLELLVLDLVVALEGEPIDHRRLHHGHDEAAARLGEADILEQAGGVKRLQRAVDLGGIETFAGRNLEVGADRVGFDPAVAFHNNGTDGRAGFRGLRKYRVRATPKQ